MPLLPRKACLVEVTEPAFVDALLPSLALVENARRLSLRDEAGAADLLVDSPQAFTHGLQLVPHEAIQFGKREKWHLRTDMMLRVVRHVPAQPAHNGARPGGAGVGAHVRPLVATLVFRDAPSPLQ